MPDNTEIQDSEDTNRWTDWIEEAIVKEYFKYYDYNHFSNIKSIGQGGFGKIFRANWNGQYLVLKSFLDFNNAAVKEVVHELKLHRDVQHHPNIISFCGITKSESDDESHLKKYILVMEYADGGSLRNYLRNHFTGLTWDDKYNLACQLVDAVSFLHNEGIVHRDLHSGNVLVNQKAIKLADFGLSKRIETSSKGQSNFFGVIPYIDPKKFVNGTYTLNEKSDVYSIGVLFWEISSGRLPFHVEGEQYDVALALYIIQGHREHVVPGTPEVYVKIYTDCWKGEPKERPTASEVLERLRAVNINLVVTEDYHVDSNNSSKNISSNYTSSLHGSLSQVMNNLNLLKADADIDLLMFTSKHKIQQEDLSVIVDGISQFIFNVTNEGKEPTLRKIYILKYLDSHSINLQEICDWLLENQNDTNSIFLLGYFSCFGIGTPRNYEKAFQYFTNPLIESFNLAPFYIGSCYLNGYGTERNDKLAFENFEKSAKTDCAAAQINMGFCYYTGTGVKKDLKLSVNWYEKAVSNGNLMAKYNLGLLYLNGNGTEKDHKKAFTLFKESAEGEYSGGIAFLGFCYDLAIGTKIDKKKAFELYSKAANMGAVMAQCNLARLYERGEGTAEDKNASINWYGKAAIRGDQIAQDRLKKLLKNKNRKKGVCKIT